MLAKWYGTGPRKSVYTLKITAMALSISKPIIFGTLGGEIFSRQKKNFVEATKIGVDLSLNSAAGHDSKARRPPAESSPDFEIALAKPAGDGAHHCANYFNRPSLFSSCWACFRILSLTTRSKVNFLSTTPARMSSSSMIWMPSWATERSAA